MSPRREALKQRIAAMAAAVNAAPPFSKERRALGRQYDALIQEDIYLDIVGEATEEVMLDPQDLADRWG